MIAVGEFPRPEQSMKSTRSRATKQQKAKRKDPELVCSNSEFQWSQSTLNSSVIQVLVPSLEIHGATVDYCRGKSAAGNREITSPQRKKGNQFIS